MLVLIIIFVTVTTNPKPGNLTTHLSLFEYLQDGWLCSFNHTYKRRFLMISQPLSGGFYQPNLAFYQGAMACLLS